MPEHSFANLFSFEDIQEIGVSPSLGRKGLRVDDLQKFIGRRFGIFRIYYVDQYQREQSFQTIHETSFMHFSQNKSSKENGKRE